MSDLISRDTALKILNDGGSSIRTMLCGDNDIWINLMDAIGEIERVQAAEPVQRGTWELVSVGVNGHITAYHGCSACGCVFKSPSRYCPGCGAKMDGGATGNENRDH